MGRRRVPPGFRFHPTDEELVAYYLKRKVSGRSMEADVIAVVDLYKCEPWDLPGMWRWQEACLSVGFIVVFCCSNFFLSFFLLRDVLCFCHVFFVFPFSTRYLEKKF
jgi:hypothetical protein